jgi:hypothetical protein
MGKVYLVANGIINTIWCLCPKRNDRSCLDEIDAMRVRLASFGLLEGMLDYLAAPDAGVCLFLYCDSC